MIDKKSNSVFCPYCSQKASFVSGDVVYPRRLDLSKKFFYICYACNAYVGCHEKTNKPFGDLANAELRFWRKKAHEVFDLIWKSGKMSRKSAYNWLSTKLNLPPNKTHVGMFDVEKCRQTIELAKKKGF